MTPLLMLDTEKATDGSPRQISEGNLQKGLTINFHKPDYKIVSRGPRLKCQLLIK